jgi:hypothetical protein
MTDTMLPHPEPSEEASSLPVVGYAIRESDQFMWAPPVSRPFAKAWRAVVYEADAQSQLNAMRAERDAARLDAQELRAIASARGSEITALKAAPVVDVERIMALADEYARAIVDAVDSQASEIPELAEREALRAALASPEGSQR